MKQISLAFYFVLHRSRYKFIQNFLPLAQITTCDKWVKNLKFLPGMNKNVFKILQLKLGSADVKNRVAVLLIDDISLRKKLVFDWQMGNISGYETDGCSTSKKLACYGTTFVAQGIHDRWRQPLGYVLSASPTPACKIKDYVSNYVEELKKIGINVVATSTDQGSNFQGAFNLMKVNNNNYSDTKENPEIKTTFGDHIINFKDISHVGKSARNFLLNNDKKGGIKVPGHSYTAKWSHLKTFYNLDRSRPRVIAHRLKRRHVFNLSKRNLMNVSGAFKVLSKSVASGLLTYYITSGLMSNEVLPTADYLERFNDIIDVLNSNLKYDKTYLRRPFSMTCPGVKTLKEGTNGTNFRGS